MSLIAWLVLISAGFQAVYSKCLFGVIGVDGECILCSDQPCLNDPSLCPGCQVQCDSQPCLNGNCTVLPQNKYNCTCEPLWKGFNCSIPVEHCESNPCLNGNCTSTADGYTCTCECGWTGENCHTVEDAECGASPRGSNVCILLAVVLLGYVLLVITGVGLQDA